MSWFVCVGTPCRGIQNVELGRCDMCDCEGFVQELTAPLFGED